MIDGVIVQSLKLLPNDRGHLMEIQRDDDPAFPGFGQAYVTSTYQGVIKAWYRHHRQIDQITVAKGLLKLVLYDDRKDSATQGEVQVIYLGESAPKLVQIPRLVWHGFQAVGESSALAVHLNSIPYNFNDPDEDRIAHDDASIPFSWT